MQCIYTCLLSRERYLDKYHAPSHRSSGPYDHQTNDAAFLEIHQILESSCKIGIYTDKDLKDRIMFSVEQSAILNDLARELNGLTVANQAETIVGLFDEETVLKLAKSFWEKTWSKFINFGTAGAGVIGVLIFFHLLKSIPDVIVQSYTLNIVFGWSLYLLGAIWTFLKIRTLNAPTTTVRTASIKCTQTYHCDAHIRLTYTTRRK